MDSSSFSWPLNETKYGAKKSAGLLACSRLYASSSSYCKDKQGDKRHYKGERSDRPNLLHSNSSSSSIAKWVKETKLKSGFEFFKTSQIEKSAYIVLNSFKLFFNQFLRLKLLQ